MESLGGAVYGGTVMGVGVVPWIQLSVELVGAETAIIVLHASSLSALRSLSSVSSQVRL